MSILRFFQRDPTRDWPLCSPVPLRFDTVRSELNGIPFGAPLDALRPLGRPANPKPLRRRECVYPPLGLEITLDSSDQVHYFGCIFDLEKSESALRDYPDSKPCHLTLRLANGAQLKIAPGISATELEQSLGPLTYDGDENDPLHSVTLGSTWLAFGFDPAGRLVFMDIEPAPSAG